MGKMIFSLLLFPLLLFSQTQIVTKKYSGDKKYSTGSSNLTISTFQKSNFVDSVAFIIEKDTVIVSNVSPKEKPDWKVEQTYLEPYIISCCTELLFYPSPDSEITFNIDGIKMILYSDGKKSGFFVFMGTKIFSTFNLKQIKQIFKQLNPDG